MKNPLLLVLLALSLLTTSCGGEKKTLTVSADDTNPAVFPVPTADDRKPPVSPIPAPVGSPTVSPLAPTAEPPGVEGTVDAFLWAWKNGDYSAMYALTTPTTQAMIGPDAFAQRYSQALAAAGVISVTTELQAVLQWDRQAQVAYSLTWNTALVGDLQVKANMNLAFEGERWGVVWNEGLIWPDMYGGHFLYMDYRTPARANIYDRDGRGLAVKSQLVSIGVIPGQINDETKLLNILGAVTGLSPSDVQAKYAGQPLNWYIPIADVSIETAQYHHEALETTAGVALKEKDARSYGSGGIAPHVIGFMGLIPAEQLNDYRADGYRGDEWVGVAGLESWAEPILSGQPDVALRVVAADGRAHRSLAEKKSVASRPIYTTLHRDFQLKVQKILDDRAGAIVVLDANTGAVRAMASGPGFDPNVFIIPGAEIERSTLLSDPRSPLLNRATQGTYPLGSVFKIVTMAAALEVGGFTPDSLYNCTGVWSELGPSNVKKGWLEGGHGTLTLVQGLERSSNPYFYHIGLALANQGFDILPRYARAFGLGQLTGLEGVAEAAGLMPDPAWKLETEGENWSPGDSVNLAIGQGSVLVTPLQVARFVAAVANGGTLFRPRIIDRIGAAPDGSAPEEIVEPIVVGELPVSEENLYAIRQGMEGVAQRAGGTATHRFYGLSVPVAGKTGTAEVPGQTSLPHSWFAGYAPANCDALPEGCEEQVAIVVIVENAGEGSAVAAPLFRQVVEAYFGLPETPLPPEASATTAMAAP